MEGIFGSPTQGFTKSNQKPAIKIQDSSVKIRTAQVELALRTLHLAAAFAQLR
jgi:hypothetical protein